jgi:hypothetical protein
MTALDKLRSSTQPHLWFIFKHSVTVKYFPVPKSYYLKGRWYKNEEKCNSTLLHKQVDVSTSNTSRAPHEYDDITVFWHCYILQIVYFVRNCRYLQKSHEISFDILNKFLNFNVIYITEREEDYLSI